MQRYSHAYTYVYVYSVHRGGKRTAKQRNSYNQSSHILRTRDQSATCHATPAGKGEVYLYSSDHESWIQITAFFSASSLLFASLLIRREWIHHTTVFPVLCSKLSYFFQRVGGGDGSCENVASDVMLDVLSSKRPGFFWGCRVIGPPRAGFESSVACLSVRLLDGSAQEVSCCGYWCLVYIRVSLSLTLLRRDGMRFLEKSWWCWIAGDDVVHVCENRTRLLR